MKGEKKGSTQQSEKNYFDFKGTNFGITLKSKYVFRFRFRFSLRNMIRISFNFWIRTNFRISFRSFC